MTGGPRTALAKGHNRVEEEKQESISGPVGLILCRCGRGVEDWVDLAAVSRTVSEDPSLAWIRTVDFACTGSGLSSIVNDAASLPVIVAACSVDLHGFTFRTALKEAGLDSSRVRLVDLRSEGHRARTRTLGTQFAVDRLEKSLAHVKGAFALPAANHKILVIGGSMAACEALRILHAAGATVESLESEQVIGLEGRTGDFRLTMADGQRVGCGLIVLGFPLRPRSLDLGIRFRPESQVMNLGEAERTFADRNDPVETIVPTEALEPNKAPEPTDVALISGALAGPALSRSPGVGLARTAEFAFTLRQALPRARIVLFHGSSEGGPVDVAELLAALRREASVVTVRSIVHRGVGASGRLHILATDRDLGKRISVATDLVVVDPGDDVDPECARWCGLLGLPVPTSPLEDSLFVGRSGVLLCSGLRPLDPTQELVRGAACAAHALAWLGEHRSLDR